MKFIIRINHSLYVIFLIFVYLSNIRVTCDTFMQGQNDTKKVSFEEVDRLKDDPNHILIDVREPSEFAEGSIPGSINIPLNDLKSALKLSPNDFKNIYGRKKPDENFNIIFSCRSGKRSQLALESSLVVLGYKNVSSYSGSWLDWKRHTKNAS